MKKGKKFLTWAFVVLVAAGMLGFNTFAGIFTPPTRLSNRELALTCTSDDLTRFHIHPHLSIIINGAAQTIPANVGITLTCLHPVHTHDATGVIHIESPEPRDFTLADFFAVWGKPFFKDQILDFPADATHEITMTVDGTPSEAYENLVLKDNQQIVITYAKVAQAK